MYQKNQDRQRSYERDRSYDNERSHKRDRSRDKSHRERRHGKQDSEDEGDHHRSRHRKRQTASKKRVRFNEDITDIKIFRKQDEPNAKGLTEAEIQQMKLKFEKDVSRTYDFNWDQKKHFDALSQGTSIKLQKQKQKVLSQRLMSVKEISNFYSPYFLKGMDGIWGMDSQQKFNHTSRINQILGCYYTHPSQIPNQPLLQILNNSSNQIPKIIKFDKQSYQTEHGKLDSNPFPYTAKKTEQQTSEKLIKGILKNIPPEKIKEENIYRTIDPALITLLRDLKINRTNYTKEKRQTLLKPFKQSGELDYVYKNPGLLQQLLRKPVGHTYPIIGGTSINGVPVMNSMPSMGPIPSSGVPISQISAVLGGVNPTITDRRVTQYPNGGPESMNSFRSPSMNRTDKYKTVPCKYYHSPQGCVKTQNCTFIHDQQYMGQPTPSMMKYNRSQQAMLGVHYDGPLVPYPMMQVPPQQAPYYEGQNGYFNGSNPNGYGNANYPQQQYGFIDGQQQQQQQQYEQKMHNVQYNSIQRPEQQQQQSFSNNNNYNNSSPPYYQTNRRNQ